MRPVLFLLNVYLSETLQKSDRIHAQLNYGKIWGLDPFTINQILNECNGRSFTNVGILHLKK